MRSNSEMRFTSAKTRPAHMQTVCARLDVLNIDIFGVYIESENNCYVRTGRTNRVEWCKISEWSAFEMKSKRKPGPKKHSFKYNAMQFDPLSESEYNRILSRLAKSHQISEYEAHRALSSYMRGGLSRVLSSEIDQLCIELADPS